MKDFVTNLFSFFSLFMQAEPLQFIVLFYLILVKVYFRKVRAIIPCLEVVSSK